MMEELITTILNSVKSYGPLGLLFAYVFIKDLKFNKKLNGNGKTPSIMEVVALVDRANKQDVKLAKTDFELKQLKDDVSSMVLRTEERFDQIDSKIDYKFDKLTQLIREKNA
jgi:hypothetical protein